LVAKNPLDRLSNPARLIAEGLLGAHAVIKIHEPEYEDWSEDEFTMPDLTPEIVAKMLVNVSYGDEESEDDFIMPVMTPEILAKMRANMAAAG
jgi:hypothetical protein